MSSPEGRAFRASAQQKTETSLSFDGGKTWTVIACTEHAIEVHVRPLADLEIVRLKGAQK